MLNIADICNNSEIVDEVELLTLVEEQIPKYKLRYDTITQFSGNNQLSGIV